MATALESAFPRKVDRDLITHPLYQLVDWNTEHLLTYPTVELTFGVDGYQQLADDAALGRRVARWRSRNPTLAALLEAEATLDALTGTGS
jgi:hypothetical protein